MNDYPYPIGPPTFRPSTTCRVQTCNAPHTTRVDVEGISYPVCAAHAFTEPSEPHTTAYRESGRDFICWARCTCGWSKEWAGRPTGIIGLYEHLGLAKLAAESHEEAHRADGR